MTGQEPRVPPEPAVRSDPESYTDAYSNAPQTAGLTESLVEAISKAHGILGASLGVHVNDGFGEATATAWSEGHTAGFEEGVAQRDRLRAALADISDTLHRNNADFSGLASQYAAVYEIGTAIQRARVALSEPTPSTVAAKVDALEAVVHPEGRCTECGGGKPYWKHSRGEVLAGHHEFQPEAPE